MRIVIVMIAAASASLAGCGASIRTEIAGRGIATIAPRGGDAGTPAPGVMLPAGVYDLALRFDVPRAQRVQWRAACADVSVGGTLGESLEDYRARRLAELRSARDDKRTFVSSLTSALVDGVAHRTTVSAPGATVTADPGAAAGAVAATSVGEVGELPASDVGAGKLTDRVRVTTNEPGTCAITATVDDANVTGGFVATRIHDLDAEAHARRVALTDAAISVRGSISARLVAGGADADARLHRRELVAMRIDVARAELIAWMTKCGGDPDRRARITARLDDGALDARVRMRGYLVGLGAVVRIARPSIAEPAPASGSDVAVDPIASAVANPEVIAPTPPTIVVPGVVISSPGGALGVLGVVRRPPVTHAPTVHRTPSPLRQNSGRQRAD